MKTNPYDAIRDNHVEAKRIRGSLSLLYAVRECPTNEPYREELDYEIECETARLEKIEKSLTLGVTD